MFSCSFREVVVSGPINGTLRDCASQKYDNQVYKDGKWHLEVSVEEPYIEGCAKVDDKGQRISQPQFCYCKGDLCNGVTANGFSMNLLMSVVILPLIYVRFRCESL